MKVIRQPLIWKFVLFSVVFLLAACSPSPVTLPVNDSRVINNGSSFGQSFTAQYDGLSGVSVLLEPSANPTSGSLLFHLRTDPHSQDEIASAHLPLTEVTHKDYYKFDFPPQMDSRGKDYFLKAEVVDGGEVKLFTAEADSYLDGALYENQTPQDAQLGFRLEYDQKYYLLGLTKLAVQWLGVLSVGLFAFILPGWAIFSLLWRGWDDLNWPSKLGLSCGISLAVYPLLFLWTDLIGLHLGPLYAWLPSILGLIALGWKNRRFFLHIRLFLHNQNSVYLEQRKNHPESLLADIAFLVVLGLIVISRFWVIKSLEIPLYGDSYQHTMITQLMIDQGGLFNSWEPYANLVTFTYHYGLHSAVAIYHWISGLSAEIAMLWTGQLLNILAILSLYPLAYKITKNRWAGVLAILVAGLLSPMPMSYVNWGRYTQLAGQVILSAAIWAAWSLLERPFPDWQNISWVRRLVNWRHLGFNLGNLTVAWLAVGGIALTHYRILILFILFSPAYLIITYSRKTLLSMLGRIVWIGIGGIFISAPWFIRIIGGRLFRGIAIQISTMPSNISTSTEVFQGISNIQVYLPIVIWILFILCIGWSLWKQRKDIAIISLWWFLVILATNPWWIGLPGSGIISNFAIFIAFYIPASLVIASVIAWMPASNQQHINVDYQSTTGKWNRLLLPSAMLLIICLLGFFGLTNRINDLDISRYELVTQADLRAMEWIKANTTLNDTFLVNSFFAYDDSLAVGSDGGWWIPILAGRKTTLPPLTYGIEDGSQVTDFKEINDFNREILTKGITNPDVISKLKENRIKYIYIGQRQGTVNNSGPKVLDPQILINDPNFEVKYNQDRVWIFKLIE
jgi:hypothetical protein